MFKPVFVALIFILSSMALPAVAQEKTPAKELVQYVRDSKKAGQKDVQIQENAVKAGWDAAAVEAAISYVRDQAGAVPKPEPAAPKQDTSAGTPIASAPSVIQPPATPVQAQPGPAASPQPTEAVVSPGEPASNAGQPAEPRVTNRGVPDEYKIGEGDVLQVAVYGEPGASVGSVVVRPDGKITVPLIKEVQVAGLTPTQVEKIVTDQLSPIIKAPDVTIVVVQINSKKIYITGAVKKEGTIPYNYRMTVMQAISEAGGLTDYAKRKKIYVMRNEGGRQFQLPFDYDAILKGQRMELNIPLIPGDQIVVP